MSTAGVFPTAPEVRDRHLDLPGIASPCSALAAEAVELPEQPERGPATVRAIDRRNHAKWATPHHPPGSEAAYEERKGACDAHPPPLEPDGFPAEAKAT